MNRALALLLTGLTGFSGLVYEVTWQKYLAILLGSHSEATAAVLGLFLGGLAVGYRLFGAASLRIVQRNPTEPSASRLLRFYGVVEAAIGIYALLFPILFGAAQSLSFRIPHAAGGLGFTFDVLLCGALIGLPAVLMGGTIPILTQALARGAEEATRVHAWVYSCNTLGAFLGALAAGFFLVPMLGLGSTMVAMGVVNLVAGGVFFLFAGRAQGGASVAVAPAAPVPEGVATYAFVALLAGFAMMTIQTVFNRIGALSFGASHFTFSMVVAVFVLCIAIGSLAVSALRRIGPGVIVGSQALLVVLLFLLYMPLPGATIAAWKLRLVFRSEDAAFYPYYISAFVGLLLVLVLPVGLSGATLPLLFHHLRGRGDGPRGELGAVAGRLYAWNTAGSLAGALLGGYALLFWFDLADVYRLAVAAMAVAVGLLAVRMLRLPAIGVLAFGVAPLIGALAMLPPWDPALLSIGKFRDRGDAGRPTLTRASEIMEMRVPFYVDDPTMSVAVREWGGDGVPLSRSIMNNGKSDSSIPDEYPTMALIALLPALFAEHCESAFVVGYGTGVTAGELASLDSMREVVVAEISPGVIEAAPFFEYGNQAALANPKVRLVRGDAYRLLMRSEDHYDVIASEPSNPWVAGVEMLYSREFLQAVRDHLSKGGVFLQWYHLYESDTATFEIVLRSYLSVFDDVAVWYGLGKDVLILGFDDAGRALDLPKLAERVALPDYRAALARGGVEGLPELLAHELLPVGVIRAAGIEAELHTLLHPILSQRAARAFFRGDEAALPPTHMLRPARIGRENSLLRRLLTGERDEERAAEQRLRAARETCSLRSRECASLLADWLHAEPDSETLAALFEEIREGPLGDEAPDRALVSELASLYGDAAAAVEGGDGFARAQRATELFLDYYHHAVPFPPESIAAVWRACAEKDEDREFCRAGWRLARSRIRGTPPVALDPPS